MRVRMNDVAIANGHEAIANGHSGHSRDSTEAPGRARPGRPSAATTWE